MLEQPGRPRWRYAKGAYPLNGTRQALDADIEREQAARSSLALQLVGRAAHVRS